MVEVLRNTVMITGFVFVMMLVIEFVNVLTSGTWQRKVAGSRFGQYFLAALLGIVPGCLGAFAVVAMYSHRVISLGALVTAMIATSGDEMFVMLAMIPRDAVLLSGLLFVTGIVVGIVTDLLLKRSPAATAFCCEGMVVHDEHAGSYLVMGNFISQWKKCSPARGTLAILLAVLIAGILSGQIGHHEHGNGHGVGGLEGSGRIVEQDVSPEHDHEGKNADDLEKDAREDGGSLPGGHQENAGVDDHQGTEHGGSEWGWIRITMLAVSVAALLIVALVSDHFLEEHLWQHIARNHLLPIFLWTFGALLFLYIVSEFLNIDLRTVAGENRWILLGLACLVGIIPQSGPHLVFVSLYASGIIPFSVLLASSIVQDGHGMLPMLAHSRRGFFTVKAINLITGFLIGAAAFLAGY